MTNYGSYDNHLNEVLIKKCGSIYGVIFLYDFIIIFRPIIFDNLIT